LIRKILTEAARLVQRPASAAALVGTEAEIPCTTLAGRHTKSGDAASVVGTRETREAGRRGCVGVAVVGNLAVRRSVFAFPRQSVAYGAVRAVQQARIRRRRNHRRPAAAEKGERQAEDDERAGEPHGQRVFSKRRHVSRDVAVRTSRPIHHENVLVSRDASWRTESEEGSMKRFIKGYVPSVAVASSVLLACVLGCGGGSSSVVVAAASVAGAAPTVCATFYADAHLKGATLVSTGPADHSPTIPATFNDVMSSVAVTPGCTVVAYPDGNYGGQEVTLTQTTETVPAPINDQMSSYKCTCAGGGGVDK
jgi:hypothetical protein